MVNLIYEVQISHYWHLQCGANNSYPTYILGRGGYLGYRHADAEDGVGSKFVLVIRAVHGQLKNVKFNGSFNVKKTKSSPWAGRSSPARQGPCTSPQFLGQSGCSRCEPPAGKCWNKKLCRCSGNLLDSLAVPGLSLVPHLQGLINTGRSSRWDSSSEKLICEKSNLIIAGFFTWRFPSLWWGRPPRWGCPWSRRSGERGSSWWASCWRDCGSER